MVLLIIIPMKNGYFIGNINPTFSDKPIFHKSSSLLFHPILVIHGNTTIQAATVLDSNMDQHGVNMV